MSSQTDCARATTERLPHNAYPRRAVGRRRAALELRVGVRVGGRRALLLLFLLLLLGAVLGLGALLRRLRVGRSAATGGEAQRSPDWERPRAPFSPTSRPRAGGGPTSTAIVGACSCCACSARRVAPRRVTASSRASFRHRRATTTQPSKPPLVWTGTRFATSCLSGSRHRSGVLPSLPTTTV